MKLCQYIVNSGKKQKVDAVEVMARESANLQADVEMGEVSSVSKVIDTEIAVRVFLDKRLGSSFTNTPTKPAGDRALRMAMSAAEVMTSDPSWVSLPQVAKAYPKLSGMWDDSVISADPGSVVESVSSVAGKAAAAEKGLIPANVSAGTFTSKTAYSNSNGVSHSEGSTTAFAVLVGVAPVEGGMTPAVVSYDIQRGLKLDYDHVVDDVVSTIRLCRKRARAVTGRHTVVMHPSALSQLLSYTLLESIRGDHVARGKSKIGDKIGEKIASHLISIYDDGLNPRGFTSSVADDEGVPRQKTPIIEKGVLRSFLWDTYWANRMGVQSTGNATRNMRQGIVAIAKTNLVISPGRRDIKDIVSEIRHGYYIRDVQGAHSSNPESGDFSIVGNPAILIEDGGFVGAIQGLMVAGNIYDLLSSTVEVARDPIYLLGTIAPEIAFGNTSIIAKAD